ncbi:VOC family protein [Carboxylicivirga taeanensis]|uniref:VOC family protein n=1 Tax=Carboxylicivirga taeanensis TaxID=1416875 RepID=UPI003F6DBB8B
MELINIRLLVEDFDKCFQFYSEQLGFNVTWGKLGGEYASFTIGQAPNGTGLSIFKSDLMAQAIGNAEQALPSNMREKMALILKVDDVDATFEKLSAKGVVFINTPTDMTGWGMRAVHFRDPENNLIEIWSELPKEKWDKELQADADEFGG